MIVDDHIQTRRSTCEILEKEHDFEIIAEADTLFEAEVLTAKAQPDVILLDQHIPGWNGFEALEQIRAYSPASRIIVFTTSQQKQHICTALMYGAIGYITKDASPDILVCAVRSAIRGDLYIPGPLARHVVAQLQALGHMQAIYQRNRQEQERSKYSQIPSMPQTTVSYRLSRRRAAQDSAFIHIPDSLPSASTQTARPLTEREQEILALIRRGCKNREIAGELCIAESTVHKHVQNIFEKLHARNRTEAIYLTSAR
jgi:DNA-binding NarL/FixJ family response regulator